MLITRKTVKNQINFNKSNEVKIIEVLVENKLEDQNKLFGRNKFLTSVIFEGENKNIGKLLKIRVDKSNQNSLFGKIEKNMRAA